MFTFHSYNCSYFTIIVCNWVLLKVQVKWYRYKPDVTQGVGTGIALLFHDRGTWRGWGISSTPRPHFTHGKDPVPILQEVGWATGPVWMARKPRPHRDSFPESPAHSQSLYQLSYLPHNSVLLIYLLPTIFKKGRRTDSAHLLLMQVVGFCIMTPYCLVGVTVVLAENLPSTIIHRSFWKDTHLLHYTLS